MKLIRVYKNPAPAQAPTANESRDNPYHGALMIADISSTPPKCTMVGVLNASISRVVALRLDSAISAITTNCKPVSAAADEPIRKKKVSQAASGECATSIVYDFNL